MLSSEDTRLFSTIEDEFVDHISISLGTVLFGVAPEALSHDLREAVFFAICEAFPLALVSDISQAFKTFVQVEKVYSVSRDQFTGPVFAYMKRKHVLQNEIKTLFQSERETIENRIGFRKQAEKKYSECLEAGEWTGTPPEANSLARDYAHFFTPEEKQKLANEAKVLELAQDKNTDPFAPRFPHVIMYSHLMISECVKKGMMLITE